jgi:glutamyl-tRNA synthetase
VIQTVKERARTLDELTAQARPFFAADIAYDEKAVQKHWKDRDATAKRLRALADRFTAVESFEPEPLEGELRGLADELEISAAKLIHPLRVALMGVAVSPGIFDVLSLMGRERTLERLARARAYLANESGHPA